MTSQGTGKLLKQILSLENVSKAGEKPKGAVITDDDALKAKFQEPDWIEKNQLGRRNLQPFSRVELALKLEPLLRKKAKENQATGKSGKGEPLPQNSAKADTREELATQHAVSAATVKRAGKFAEQVERTPAMAKAVEERRPQTQLDFVPQNSAEQMTDADAIERPKATVTHRLTHDGRTVHFANRPNAVHLLRVLEAAAASPAQAVGKRNGFIGWPDNLHGFRIAAHGDGSNACRQLPTSFPDCIVVPGRVGLADTCRHLSWQNDVLTYHEAQKQTSALHLQTLVLMVFLRICQKV